MSYSFDLELYTLNNGVVSYEYLGNYPTWDPIFDRHNWDTTYIFTELCETVVVQGAKGTELALAILNTETQVYCAWYRNGKYEGWRYGFSDVDSIVWDRFCITPNVKVFCDKSFTSNEDPTRPYTFGTGSRALLFNSQNIGTNINFWEHGLVENAAFDFETITSDNFVEVWNQTITDAIRTTEDDCVLWRNLLPEDTKVLWFN